MKQKSMHLQGLRKATSLITAITVFASEGAFAAVYQWSGSTNSIWNEPGNWPSVAGSTAGVPPTSGAHRINIQPVSTNAAVFNFPATTMTYGGTGIRGLVIANGVNGTMNITGGTFSTEGNTVIGTGTQPNTADVIGNGNGTTALLNIDGGNYISGASGLSMGVGGSQNAFPSSSTLNISNGSATVTALTMLNNTVTINLNSGGTLAANSITYLGWNSLLNFDGGTLRARTNNPAFVPDGVNFSAYVKAGGATIDTNSFNVTIAEALLRDPASTGGDLTKIGAGTLTLASPSTIDGDVTISSGGLGVKAGTVSWQPATLNHSGDTLNFDLGVYNPANPPLIDVAELTLNTTDITVNISGSSIPVSSEIKILEYGTNPGAGSLKLNITSLPNNMVATLEENTIDGYYYLNVTSPSATSFTWSGDTNPDASGAWNTSSSNWGNNTAVYAEPALVSFPNIAGGGSVSITNDVAPLSFEINNATNNNYTFSGSGKITGNTGITKAGSGITTFNGAAHTYAGALSINSGAVVKNVADDTTGNISVASGASFGLTGGITDGSGQTLSLAGTGLTAVNGVFAAVQRGALQSVSGSNTWAGNISIPVAGTGLRIGTQNDAQLTLSGNIIESVPGCAVIFRMGNTVGSDITVTGTANNWTGDTQVFGGGKLILGADNALPAASRLLVGTSGVNANTYIDLNGNDQTSAGLNRVNYSTTDLAFISNGGPTPSVLTLQPATDQSWLGVIQDGVSPVSLVISGTATQGLSLPSTYTGTTTIQSGRLEIQENQAATGDVIINGGSIKLSYARTLSTGVNMSIASGAFFYLDGSSQTLGKLEGAGTIDFTYNIPGVDTITVGANDSTSTFNGIIQQSLLRTCALHKIGTGTFTLTGLNTYTGNTTVEDGTLGVAQSNFADTSTVTIGLTEASSAVLNLPNTGTDIVAELVIDGVSQPGNGIVYDENNSAGAISGPGKIQVGVSGYPAWVITNNVLLGENGDDDKDGIINLVEYALGLNPHASSVPAGDFVENLLTFIKGPEAKIAMDVTYRIETSTTLADNSWTEAAATDNTDSISFQIPPNQPGGKIFARLKVTKP